MWQTQSPWIISIYSRILWSECCKFLSRWTLSKFGCQLPHHILWNAWVGLWDTIFCSITHHASIPNINPGSFKHCGRIWFHNMLEVFKRISNRRTDQFPISVVWKAVARNSWEHRPSLPIEWAIPSDSIWRRFSFLEHRRKLSNNLMQSVYGWTMRYNNVRRTWFVTYWWWFFVNFTILGKFYRIFTPGLHFLLKWVSDWDYG